MTVDDLVFMRWLALAFAALELLGWLLWVMAGWLLAGDERAVVRQARRAGLGWDQIAEVFGTTAGKAREKYGEPAPSGEGW